jgi:transcription elongation factor Elf1
MMMKELNEAITRLRKAREEVRERLLNLFVGIKDKGKRTSFVRQFYWQHLEIDEDLLAGVLGISRYALTKMIGEKSAVVTCSRCGENFRIMAKSRKDLNSTYIRYRHLGHLCKTDEKQLRLLELREMPYDEYLRTDEWNNIRSRAVRDAKLKCQRCGKRGKLHVHHLSYSHLGEERDNELLVLCVSCHSKYHPERARFSD